MNVYHKGNVFFNTYFNSTLIITKINFDYTCKAIFISDFEHEIYEYDLIQIEINIERNTLIPLN